MWAAVCRRCAKKNTENHSKALQSHFGCTSSYVLTLNVQQIGKPILTFLMFYNIFKQIKQSRLGDIYSKAVGAGSSKISMQARKLPSPTNNVLSTEFIGQHTSSWQSHLQWISPSLLPENRVWWQTMQDGYEFFDGNDVPDTRIEGPPLLHFRNTALGDIYHSKYEFWRQLMGNETIFKTSQHRWEIYMM